MNEPTTQYGLRDRSKWPSGPWDDEPDRAIWVDPETGLDCLMLRNGLGAWCGYVGVPEGHRYFGKDYDDVPVETHGGLTYADECDGRPDIGICHVPREGQSGEVWWLGFDCAHSGDIVPGMPDRSTYSSLGERYRSYLYVKRQVEHLAAQIKQNGTTNEND